MEVHASRPCQRSDTREIMKVISGLKDRFDGIGFVSHDVILFSYTRFVFTHGLDLSVGET